MLAKDMTTVTDSVQSQPLYQQAKSLILKGIINGKWRPGERLPSEFELGHRLGVSQGTVRKALNAMANEGLVVRRQGRGTYVAEHDQQQTLFKFFHIISETHEREIPESRILDAVADEATEEEAKILFFDGEARVLRIKRLRSLNGKPCIVETIIVPAWLINDIAEAKELPNTVYRYYQRTHGVTVARAIEKLRAVAATEADAELLSVARGMPLLEIDRVAVDLQGRSVERRISRCITDGYHYRAELG